MVKKNIKNMNKFYLKYSNILEQEFKAKNKNDNIKYVNLTNHMVKNCDKIETCELRREFIDYSKLNIHLTFGPTLKLFLKYILDDIYEYKYSNNKIKLFLKNEVKYDKMKKKEHYLVKKDFKYIDNIMNPNYNNLYDLNKSNILDGEKVIKKFYKSMKKSNNKVKKIKTDKIKTNKKLINKSKKIKKLTKKLLDERKEKILLKFLRDKQIFLREL
jgi:hypothetical protein